MYTKKKSDYKGSEAQSSVDNAAGKGINAVQLKDNRHASAIQKKQADALSNKIVQSPTQKKANNTGLPDQLKGGVENLSGYSMDDVKVHYNSAQPAQLNAHAYAQGTDIHIASGQEKHLPHEAWHVVQQKQGRVKPTMQMKGKVNINNEKGLENEADVMGRKALSVQNENLQRKEIISGANSSANTIQPIMKALNINKEEYNKRARTTVFLLATYNGHYLGIFQSTSAGHAEENLIEEINKRGLRDGTLEVELSASPCSSDFGTRSDGEHGCQENLEKLQKTHNITVKVKADHLYQPKEIGSMECENNEKSGFSSLAAAHTSTFDIELSKIPKTYEKDYQELKSTDSGIIQR